jgi:hypothetical protein
MIAASARPCKHSSPILNGQGILWCEEMQGPCVASCEGGISLEEMSCYEHKLVQLLAYSNYQ